MAVTQFAEDFDANDSAGLVGAPKFPPADRIVVTPSLLSSHGGSPTLTMVRTTFDAMAAGGIYDHIGGGFARYSTDERWLVPHFEKMLYDNSLLARVYWRPIKSRETTNYRRVACETLDYILRNDLALKEGFIPPPTPTPKGSKGSSSSGRRRRCAPVDRR